MRLCLTLSLLFGLPVAIAAQGGSGDKPPVAADGRRMSEDIEVMRRLLQRSIENAVGPLSHAAPRARGANTRTDFIPSITNELFTQPNTSGYQNTLSTIYGVGLTDYMTISRVHTSAPVEGNYLKGYGVVFTITLPRSAATTPAPSTQPAAKPLSDWERTRRELLGQPAPEAPATPPATRPALIDALLKCLADNGRHFSQL